MNLNRSSIISALALGLLGATSLSTAAFASAYGLREGSADWMANGFAGEPAKAYDASTAYANPAGMSRLDQDEFDGAISYISPDIKFHGTNSNPYGGNVSGTSGGNDIAPAADAGSYAVLVLSPAWRLGFSVTAPYGERIAYPSDFVGRYQSLVTSVTDFNLGLALSYKVDDHLSVGFGPNFDYFIGRLTGAINAGPLSTATGQDAIADFHGNSLGVGYNLGALYQFDDNNRLGLDYRSRIRHNIYGQQAVGVPAVYGVASPATAAALSALNTSATTNITLPDSLSIGYYSQITPRWAVMTSVVWTEWSLFKNLDITATNGTGASITQENWHNAWYAGIGTSYQLLDNLLLQTGFGWDQSPVTDTNRTSRVPDSDHYVLGMGAQYQLLPSTKLELAYSHIFAPDGTINNAASAGSGTITGHYHLSANSFTVGLNTKF